MSKHFVLTLEKSVHEQLKNDLLAKGFTLSTPPYTVFQAKGKDLNITLYTSGKVVIQGKAAQEFIEFYLEPEVLQDTPITHAKARLDTKSRIGADESGKGDFFGPLCACAIFAEGKKIEELFDLGVRDSKTLSDEHIRTLSKQIERTFIYKKIILKPKTYNQLYARFQNLNRLLAWCHAEIITDLSLRTHCTYAIVDQFAEKHVLESFVSKKVSDFTLIQRTRAEEDLVVAAASILARASFLEELQLMKDTFNIEFPKGASSHVQNAARAFANKFGTQALHDVAKTHFSTYAKICTEPL